MRTSLITLAALWIGLNSALAFAAQPQPHPALSPREVVLLQLAALKSVDQPVKDAGFATVFRFTSPENREQTGPLPRFSRMIRQGFGEMLNHKSARLLPTLQDGTRLLQPVELVGLSGRTFRYIFVLRRIEESPYQGCWMTDGVIPQEAASGSYEL